MARKSSRDAILDAVERVVKRCGLSATTIEAVAEEAGISKGGLFYHFPTKKDMFLRLLDRHEERFVELRATIMEGLPEGPTQLLKATLFACIDDQYRQYRTASNLLTLLDDVELRGRIADMKKRLFDEVARTSRHPEKVALAMLVVDGMRIADLIGRPTLSGDFRGKVIDELMHIIDCFDKEFADHGAAGAYQHASGREGKEWNAEAALAGSPQEVLQ